MLWSVKRVPPEEAIWAIDVAMTRRLGRVSGERSIRLSSQALVRFLLGKTDEDTVARLISSAEQAAADGFAVFRDFLGQGYNDRGEAGASAGNRRR